MGDELLDGAQSSLITRLPEHTAEGYRLPAIMILCGRPAAGIVYMGVHVNLSSPESSPSVAEPQCNANVTAA